MQELLIRWACDAEDNIVSPEEAMPGRAYFCPSCHSRLSLKGAKEEAKRRRHFSHQPNVACSPESVMHKTAKMLVARVVNDWRLGRGPCPVVMHRCTHCGDEVPEGLPRQVESAALEQRLPDGYIVDVGLMVAGRPRAAVEIRVTHPVDESKDGKISIRYLELAGQSVIDDPYTWRPLVDRFQPRVCASCQQAQLEAEREARRAQARREAVTKAFQARCEALSRQTGVPLPRGEYYRYSVCSCRRCEQSILVFDWRGHRQQSGEPPKGSPVPRTVRRWVDRRSGLIYWANRCPYCWAIQWVDDLCYGKGCVFGRLHYPQADTPEVYREHMAQLAEGWGEVREYYREIGQTRRWVQERELERSREQGAQKK